MFSIRTAEEEEGRSHKEGKRAMHSYICGGGGKYNIQLLIVLDFRERTPACTGRDSTNLLTHAYILFKWVKSVKSVSVLQYLNIVY